MLKSPRIEQIGTCHWQQALKQSIRSSSELLDALGLGESVKPHSKAGEDQFPVFVPLEFLSRMKRGDSTDPLLLQVLSSESEANSAPGFTSDPVGDTSVEVAPGLLHKYDGRVLMILSGACAVHCRYCFRRHYPYHSAPKSLEHWQQAIDYIKHNPSITEVILSGGDPLMVTDQRLSELLQQFDAIPHLERLRIHTRLPVVIPQRIDRSFCDVVSGTRLATWVVLHINHANEIDNEVCAAVQRLKSAGAMVLNQAVLLNGINNTVDALTDLCQKLINIGVLPYYLHQLDRVSGAQHFEVDSAVGIELISELAKRLPGYAVPKYVSEIAGEPNKSPLGFATVSKLPE